VETVSGCFYFNVSVFNYFSFEDMWTQSSFYLRQVYVLVQIEVNAKLSFKVRDKIYFTVTESKKFSST